jgi:hypothetical protein
MKRPQDAPRQVRVGDVWANASNTTRVLITQITVSHRRKDIKRICFKQLVIRGQTFSNPTEAWAEEDMDTKYFGHTDLKRVNP